MTGFQSGPIQPRKNPFMSPLGNVSGLNTSTGYTSMPTGLSAGFNQALLPSASMANTDTFSSTNTMASTLGMQNMSMPNMGMPATGGMNMGTSAGLNNIPISASCMQTMMMIATAMASVMTGLMAFVQQLLTRPPSQPTTADPTQQTTPVSQPTPTDGKTNESAPTGDASSGSSNKMEKLATAAEASAKRRNSRGMCLAGVQDAFESAGMKKDRKPSAYMMKSELSSDKRFKKIATPADLSKLPRGAIVVWDRTNKNPHGHISVALGGGKEASDHIQSQIKNLSTATVFVPV